MLETNSGLELLNLSWNHLWLGGAVSVCAALRGNTALKHLDLSWNSLGRGGAGALGDALRHNSSLLWLDLRSNRLDDAALALLGPGLAANTSLQGLRLSQNPLSADGVLVLLRTVRSNAQSALEDIDLTTIWVNPACVELLAKAVGDGSPLKARYGGVLGSYSNRKSKETSTSLNDQSTP
ncbi:leucine-rich repeat-containing protein 74A [Gadus morhua]|uniref:leucine-rich repeat-containing protein 74A n=1 Tax=Gadus morhua TaxID=8049 RepID=UPI0011B492BC|nr:leucine-rich repeat-containing protein 74A-like [Gadus morhua]